MSKRKQKPQLNIDTPLTTLTDTRNNDTSSSTSGNNAESFRKPNYFKYLPLRGRLIEMLDGTHTAAQIMEDLRITQQTLFKYKAMAQLESGLSLQTMEEKIHLKRNNQNGQSYSVPEKEK